MNHHHMRRVGGVFLASFVAVSSTAVAKAEDRRSWFQGLTMPGTGIPCCDISDCRRTQADWRNGQWWATVGGQWTPIPHNKELSKRSIDGDAYVCASPNRYVYCFIKPDLVM
jgi:hypothetical protein